MGFKTGLLVGFGVGYVLGTKAGRERYEELKASWDSFMGNPSVQRVVTRGKEVVETGPSEGSGRSRTPRKRSRLRSRAPRPHRPSREIRAGRSSGPPDEPKYGGKAAGWNMWKRVRRSHPSPMVESA